MAFCTQVTVPATAGGIVLVANGDHSNAKNVIITPAAAIFIGGVNVTASAANGLSISAATNLTLAPGDTLYAICASGTVVTSVFSSP